MTNKVKLTPQQSNIHARRVGLICLHILCGITALVCLLPIILLFITTTRSDAQILSGLSFELGTSFFKNYQTLINKLTNQYQYSILRSFFNSCLISFASTSLCIYFSALTAYACHVYDFKGKKFFEKFILFLIIIPGQIGAVGFYVLINKLSLTDNYIPFIFPAIASAATVYFLRQYMKSNFSKEYVDAARMDGANEFMIFNTICLPYIKTAIATMALFGIISSWNNLMGPMTFISDSNLYTMPQIIYQISAAPDIKIGAYYVGIFITMLPMLVIYLFLSKYIMKGTSAGGLK